MRAAAAGRPVKTENRPSPSRQPGLQLYRSRAVDEKHGRDQGRFYRPRLVERVDAGRSRVAGADPGPAASEYGVVLAEDGTVDEAATEARREELRADREDEEQFDYGPLPDYGKLAERIAAERWEFDKRHG